MMGCLQLPSLADKDLQIQIFLTAACEQTCVTLPWMEECCEADTQARACADTSVTGPSCGWEKKIGSPGGCTKVLSMFFAQKQWDKGKQLWGGWALARAPCGAATASKHVSMAKKHGMSKKTKENCSSSLRENCMKGISLPAQWRKSFVAYKEEWDSCLAKGRNHKQSHHWGIFTHFPLPSPTNTLAVLAGPGRAAEAWADHTAGVQSERNMGTPHLPVAAGTPPAVQAQPHCVPPSAGWQVGDVGTWAGRGWGF